MQSNDSDIRCGVILMLLSVLFFSANTLVIRWASLHAPGADGWNATIYRGAVGLVIILAVYGNGRGFNPRGLLANRLVIVRGIIGAIGLAAFYITIGALGASRAVVVNLSYPVFATLLAVPVLGERVSTRALVWILIGFGGLVGFVGGGSTQGISGYDLVGVSGAVSAGLVVVLVRKLIRTQHPATIYGSQCVFGILLALPFGWQNFDKLPWQGHLALAGAAVLVTCGQLLMTFGFRLLSVSRGSAIQMLLPVITACGGYLFFGEHFGIAEYAWAVLILFATWKVTRSPQPPRTDGA
ncbi:MAG: DMT family transporter [Verrucomicrobiota bacterium]